MNPEAIYAEADALIATLRDEFARNVRDALDTEMNRGNINGPEEYLSQARKYIECLGPSALKPLASPGETTTKSRKRAPARLDDPGLTAVTDSLLPAKLGHTATAVWLCLLRHSNGRPERRVKRIGYRIIADGTGLTKQQIRDGLEVLLRFGIVQRTKKGRFRLRSEARTTAEYIVLFPTALRLEQWNLALDPVVQARKALRKAARWAKKQERGAISRET